jgi:hypothetical protein
MNVIHRTGKLGLATAYLQAFPGLFKSNIDEARTALKQLYRF